MTRLFDVLPSFYRMRDSSLAQSQNLLTPAEVALQQTLQNLPPPLTADQQLQLDELSAKARRGPLESLLMLIDEQLAVVAEDLDQLYDDQFIETCAPWVIPYLGDLIGYEAVNGIAPSVASPRAEVAHTLALRGRKGTVLVLEQLARDVTGWGAHAVEFFQLLVGSQYVNHPRPGNLYAPDLRRSDPGMDTGFDRTPRTLDVRRIASGRGSYNIPNIGVFLWSLNAYPVSRLPVSSVAAAPQCFRISPLGLDIPLFNNPVSQGVEIATPASTMNVPGRLRRKMLCDDLQKGVGSIYYGQGRTLALFSGGKFLDAFQLQVCNLSGTDGSWINLPPAGSPFAAAIDPELGRIALPPSTGDVAPDLIASFHYGFNADLGGGEYPRATSFLVQDPTSTLPFPDPASPARYVTLQDAFTFAIAEFASRSEVAIEISDSGIYTEPAFNAHLPAGTTLELRAADGARPTLILTGELAVTGAPSSVVALNGLIIHGIVHAPATSLDGTPSLLSQLSLTHCTLLPSPSQPNLLAEPPGLQLVAVKSILGGIRIAELCSANLSDSIVDSTSRTAVAYAALDASSAGGPLTVLACTIVGKVHATVLPLISDSILYAALTPDDNTWKSPLWSDRRQVGCVRFSYLPQGSVTPRTFDCIERGPLQPQPLFYSLQFGDPAYAKLLPSTPAAISRGASDGGEMGAFHFVLAPLREADLRARLQEYTPVGMEIGIIYQN